MKNRTARLQEKMFFGGLILFIFNFLKIIFKPALALAGNTTQIVASPEDIAPYNPLSESTVFSGEVTLATIIGQILQYLYPIVTILLFVILVWGGLEYMAAGVNSKSSGAEKGKKRIISALLGFALVAFSYLIILVLQSILGFTLL